MTARNTRQAFWSDAEREILREHYPAGGPTVVAERLAAAGFSRSPRAIRNMAFCMRTAMTGPRLLGWAWSPAEDDIIRTHYPTRGCRQTVAELSAAGFSRSAGATRLRAHLLGASRNGARSNPHAWSGTEERILAEQYAKGGAALARSTLFDAGYCRTRGAIRLRAHQLGIRCEAPSVARNPRPLDEASLSAIRELYPLLGGEATASRMAAMGLPPRKASAIRQYAHKKGIRCMPETQRRVRSHPKRRNIDFDVVAAVEAAKRGKWRAMA